MNLILCLNFNIEIIAFHQVAEFGGTLGLFIGFNFMSLWDTTASSFTFIKCLLEGIVTRK